MNLPIPNIDVLASAGTFNHRKQAVTQILETTLIGWIKQIKVNIPELLQKKNNLILKFFNPVNFDGKYIFNFV